MSVSPNSPGNSNPPPFVLKKWHEIVEHRNIKELNDLLAPDSVFWSPVVHTPQKGKEITLKYLRAALHVLGNKESNFSYKNEWQKTDGTGAVLEFESTIEGIKVNGVDIIEWDPKTNKIVSFKVMVRPLKAVSILQKKMGELLQAKEASKL